MKLNKFLKIAVLILPILTQATAFAGLGENEQSVEKDRQAFRGVRKVSLMPGYKKHEITTDSNHVREYVNSDGLVFAVAWDGIAHPDLTLIFGAYFPEYLAADRATPNPKGRAPKQINSSNVTTTRFGHMRDVHGKAVIPQLVPAGFDLNEVQ